MRFLEPLWRRLFTVAVLAAVGTAAIIALSRMTSISPQQPDNPAPAGQTHVTYPTAAPCAWLGEWEGRLAVFRVENAPPEEVYDVFLASLPPAEQDALTARIAIFDETELQHRLEDYTG